MKVYVATGKIEDKKYPALWFMKPMPPEGIKALRKKLGISRQELAMAIPVGLETVKSWELGRRKPDDPAIHIMRILGKKPEHLKVFLE